MSDSANILITDLNIKNKFSTFQASLAPTGSTSLWAFLKAN